MHSLTLSQENRFSNIKSIVKIKTIAKTESKSCSVLGNPNKIIHRNISFQIDVRIGNTNVLIRTFEKLTYKTSFNKLTHSRN